MIDSKYTQILNKIYNRLRNTDIVWAVTGSLGFALQGMSVEIHDIDIQTDKAGAYEIERLFKEYVVNIVNLSTSEKIRSHFGELNIDGIKVEIIGDVQKKLGEDIWEEPVNLIKYRKVIEFEGMKVPVLDLRYEYGAYLKLGRIKKAEMIKNYLDKEGG